MCGEKKNHALRFEGPHLFHAQYWKLFCSSHLKIFMSKMMYVIFFVCFFKGALCSFGEEIKTLNINIWNIKEVIIQTQKY